jgi:hypothetical protein
MSKYIVLSKRGVHSMSAGKSWYKGHYIYEGQIPDYLIAALLEDGSIELEKDTCGGVTAKGEPCKRTPLEGSEYCTTHQPEEDKQEDET